MILEAIIVCVDYSDFLAHTLPANKHNFDKLVVVTSPADIKTQKLCEYHHVMCVTTDVFYEDGASFNKAKGINFGMKSLDKTGWVLHIDSDIVLPPLFRLTLDPIDLDPTFVYGVDRLMCTSYKDWTDQQIEPHLTQESHIYIHPTSKTMKVGTRIAKYATSEGYIPIGFFQMWNPLHSGVDNYPDEHGDAGRSDMLFSMQWKRNKRGFIPEIIAIHLESEVLSTMGKNWKGRKTVAFGPGDKLVDITTDEKVVNGYKEDTTQVTSVQSQRPVIEEKMMYIHDEELAEQQIGNVKHPSFFHAKSVNTTSINTHEDLENSNESTLAVMIVVGVSVVVAIISYCTSGGFSF